MLKRRRFLVLFLALFVALPALAAERVEKLPATKPFTSARFDLAALLDGQQFIVGKGEIESANRSYYVLKTLPIENLPESTIEVVLYDGTLYTRIDDEPEYYIDAEDLPVGPPASDIGDIGQIGPLYRVGNVDIAGTPTTQYQVAVTNAPTSTDSIKLDVFIGQQLAYLYQTQVGITVSDPRAGQFKVETVQRVYDHDTPIKVNPPLTNAGPRPGITPRMIKPLRKNSMLTALHAPLMTRIVRQLAVQYAR